MSVALVTGSSRGIGAACAQALARSGYKVCINCIERMDLAQALADRLVTYVPQASLVGTLLHQDPNAQIIRSHGVGTMGQHDPFSWAVHGTGFVPLDRRSRRGERESAGFQGWVDSLDRQEREEFTEVFFSLLSASRAETLSELSQSWADSALAAVRAYGDLPPQVRRDMLDYLWRFLVNMSTGGAPRREP